MVLTGDIHTNWVNELPVDFDDLDGSTAAVEFVGTSILERRRSQEAENQSSLLSENPFVKFHNRERGYVLCEVTPDNWRSDFRTVEYVTRKVRASQHAGVVRGRKRAVEARKSVTLRTIHSIRC